MAKIKNHKHAVSLLDELRNFFSDMSSNATARKTARTSKPAKATKKPAARKTKKSVKAKKKAAKKSRGK